MIDRRPRVVVLGNKYSGLEQWSMNWCELKGWFDALSDYGLAVQVGRRRVQTQRWTLIPVSTNWWGYESEVWM